MKKIAVFLGMVFLIFVVINANYVFAEPPHQKIIERLDAIQDTLDYDVVPYLNGVGVPRTGQMTSYESGDDGDLQKGVPWPVPRFTDNGDGTVTDNLTRLIWLKNANCDGEKEWADAMTFANSLYDGWTGDGSGGDCGLSDGSSANDWRLPNVRELQSLIDYSQTNPALPSVHYFTGVQSTYYCSSTTHAAGTTSSWNIHMDVGAMSGRDKENIAYVWPVRGGN